jgi:hypothetical protein
MTHSDYTTFIRRESDGAIIPKDSANRDYQEALESGTIVAAPAVDPIPAKRAAFVASIQRLLDSAAQARGYDDISTAVTYADEPSVARFQAEGRAFRAWRSLVWASAYQVLDDVLNGRRAEPTIESLLKELPQVQLP